MKIAAVSTLSVMGVIIFSMITNVGTMPSYRKDSYSKENTFEKANRFDMYSSLPNDGNREHFGNWRQEHYGGNSFQGGYIQYPPFGNSGYSGYPKMTKDALEPRYPKHIPEPFIEKEKNTNVGHGITLGILVAAFLVLLIRSGVLFENEDSFLGIFKNQSVVVAQ